MSTDFLEDLEKFREFPIRHSDRFRLPAPTPPASSRLRLLLLLPPRNPCCCCYCLRAIPPRAVVVCGVQQAVGQSRLSRVTSFQGGAVPPETVIKE